MNSALAISLAITANVEAFWNDAISYEQFGAASLALWQKAEAAVLVAAVSALLPVNQRN